MIAAVAQHDPWGAFIVPGLVLLAVGPFAVWQLLRDLGDDR
jgi:hypothetical protein